MSFMFLESGNIIVKYLLDGVSFGLTHSTGKEAASLLLSVVSVNTFRVGSQLAFLSWIPVRKSPEAAGAEGFKPSGIIW